MKTDTLSVALDIRPMNIDMSYEEYITEPVSAGKANPFYGLKHTKSSREQMSIAAKSRPCNRKGAKLSAKTRKKVSENNAASKAFSTHLGVFKSKAEAIEKTNISGNMLRTILNCDLDKPIKRVGKVFNKKEYIGKTPRQLGWKYV